MADTDDKVTKLEAAKAGTEDSGGTGASGSGEEQGTDNQAADTGGNDTGGSSVSSSSSSGHAEADGQAGDTGLDEQQIYEGVTAEDFQSYADTVQGHLDGLTASSVVIVVALFINAGILAVSTLLRSLERG